MKRKRSTPLRDHHVKPGHCSIELRCRILGDAPYFRELPAKALDAVNSHFRALDFPVGATLYHESEPADALFLVAHGKVKLLRHGVSGDEVVLDLLAQGELFGGLATLGQRRHPQTAVAQTGCCVLAITTPDFQHLLRTYPAVALTVLDAVARDLEAAQDTIHAISTMPLEARIALVLLRLADRLGEVDGGGILIQSPLSQQDLAAMVATTAETVSRVISGLRRSGYIETGRQWIRIRDRAALARLADEVEIGG
jgi:cAMP-binding proteins - catabolite gene activator and regulatory subunit of cAMP-dependent protein kinases